MQCARQGAARMIEGAGGSEMPRRYAAACRPRVLHAARYFAASNTPDPPWQTVKNNVVFFLPPSTATRAAACWRRLAKAASQPCGAIAQRRSRAARHTRAVKAPPRMRR